MSTPLHLIVLAGGRGRRAGGDDEVPKQFRATGRGPLFAVSLHTFLAAPCPRGWHLADVTVTAPAAWHPQVEAALADLDLPWQLATPGASRTASTANALAVLDDALAPAPDDLVAVHDAARPFATAALLDALAQAALAAGAAVPGVPVTDTIVQSTGSGTAYLRRESLVAVQTPQVFRWEPFAAAHRWAAATNRDFTDDGGLLAERGLAPAVVPGEPGNWKVTTAADWDRAAGLLAGPPG